jgi:hypothetical protein
MLVETKAITELGLTVRQHLARDRDLHRGHPGHGLPGHDRGEPWRLRGVVLPFVLLLASLGLGWYVSRAGGFAPTLTGKLAAVALLSLPILLLGILFARFLDTGVSIGRPWP